MSNMVVLPLQRTIEWEPSDQESAEKAQEQFEHLVNSGLYMAMTVSTTTGEDPTLIAEFDPKAEKIVVLHRQVGG